MSEETVSATINAAINFGVPVVLIVLGYLYGRMNEARHYRSIKRREARHLNVPILTAKTYDESRKVASAKLAAGSVVVSIDYYKRFMAFLRMVFGGEVLAYSSLLDRARREAILRMRASCPGADVFLNCRLETASISKGRGKAIGSIEVIAYATGITFAK